MEKGLYGQEHQIFRDSLRKFIEREITPNVPQWEAERSVPRELRLKMAERAIEIEHARNLYSKAAMRMDQGIEFPVPEAAGAKYYATELAGNMARDAVQIFGGYGYMQSLAHDNSHYKVEQIFHDYRISEIYEGTNEIQEMIFSRTIFGREMVS